MLDFCKYMTIKLLCNHTYGVKKLRFCQYVHNYIVAFITKLYKICKSQGLVVHGL